MTYNIAFIIEQALGHITHSQNLQNNVVRDSAVQAYWGLPVWQTRGIVSKIPVLRSNWTLQAGWQSRRSLAAISRQVRLDLLFFHTQVTAVLAQDWIRRFPCVVSLDATPRQYDSLGATYAHQPGPEWLENWKWRLNRDCFSHARHLVTWSQWAKQGLVDEYQVPDEKITVIPPGVNVADWTSSPGEQGTKSTGLLPSTEAGSSLPHEAVVRILFVGGDLQRKGGLLLIEAFRALRRELSDTAQEIELHLVTRQTLPPEPGLFIYNQMQPNSPELKSLYFNSHIFCLPTFGDCLPMVLSEAGAARLPLISTRVGAIDEIVRDGETGFLIPVGDADALIAALRKLVEAPALRQSLGENAHQIVRKEYDAGANANRLLTLLKQTIAETSSAYQKP